MNSYKRKLSVKKFRYFRVKSFKDILELVKYYCFYFVIEDSEK